MEIHLCKVDRPPVGGCQSDEGAQTLQIWICYTDICYE